MRYKKKTGFNAVGEVGFKAANDLVRWRRISLKNDANDDDPNKVLHVQGNPFDTIEALSNTTESTRLSSIFKLDDEALQRLEITQKWLQDCISLASNSTSILSAAAFEAFWRTMTCGPTASARPVKPKHGDAFAAYLSFLDTGLAQYRASLAGSRSAPDGVVSIYDASFGPAAESFKLVKAGLQK